MLACCDCVSHEVFRIPGCRPFDGRDGALLCVPEGMLLQFVTVASEQDRGNSKHGHDTLQGADAEPGDGRERAAYQLGGTSGVESDRTQDVTPVTNLHCERAPRWGESDCPIPTTWPSHRSQRRQIATYTVAEHDDFTGRFEDGTSVARVVYFPDDPDSTARAVQGGRRAAARVESGIPIILDTEGPAVKASFYRFVLDHDIDFFAVDRLAWSAMHDYCEALRGCDFGLIWMVANAEDFRGGLVCGCNDGVLLPSALRDIEIQSVLQLFILHDAAVGCPSELDIHRRGQSAPSGAGGAVAAEGLSS